jgi:ACS family tartrate transporter-like MFS transporter
MGSAAGLLLGLHGRLGLVGWQWLFLIEGIPAVVLSVIVLMRLPESPAQAAWLTDEERTWIHTRLAIDKAAVGPDTDHSLARALLDPRVWQLGLCNLCILGCNYAFTLSAPAVIQGATQWNATYVGYAVALTAILGAFGMVFNGWHSDRRRERHVHTVVPLMLMAVAFLAMGVSVAAAVVVPAYVVFVVCSMAVQAVFWLIPSDVLHGRTAAVGVAAIGSIGMMGSFIGPYLWGIARDVTGSYQAGLLSLAFPHVVAALIVLVVRRQARSNVTANPVLVR